MINHHALFQETLDQTLKVEYDNKEYFANFTEGDLFELWKVLQSKKQKYPMIWLQTGYKIFHDVRGIKTEFNHLSFLFITKGSVNDYNKKRFIDTFQNVLYPLMEQFLNKIRTTNGISFGNDKYSFITLPFNDISELSSRERDYGNKKTYQNTITPDVWDAIVLDISLTIDNQCTNIKKFKTS